MPLAQALARSTWAGSCARGSEIVLTYLESGAQAESLRTSMTENGIAVLSHFTMD